MRSIKLRVAFFGWSGSFDYSRVGGTDSYIRRLAGSLAKNHNCQVSMITYGSPNQSMERIFDGFVVERCADLGDGLERLSDFDHVVAVYLLPIDRVAFATFRRQNSSRILFHRLLFTWPENVIKRWLMDIDGRLMPFNGSIFAVSPRLKRYALTWSKRVFLLLPPVPEYYFSSTESISLKGSIQATYVGRLDVDKGFREVLDLMTRLATFESIELVISAIRWPGAEDGEAFHRELLKKDYLDYRPADFNAFDARLEREIGELIGESDILLLPFRRLSSTIDIPLIMLESMAALTPVITVPLGDIPKIYGGSRSLVNAKDYVNRTFELVKSAPDWLEIECKRLASRVHELKFDTESVARRFIEAIIDQI